jgi:PAS domain S-box-containing protein
MQDPGLPAIPPGSSESFGSEEQFRLIVEAAPNALVLADRQGRIILVNKKAEELFGYARGELLGRSVDLLVPERWRGGHPAHRSSFNAAPVAREMGAGRDLFGLRKDGSEFPVEIGLNPVSNAAGDFVLASIIDITQRKRSESALRESQRRFQELFANLASGIAMWRAAPDGEDFILDSINPAGLRLISRRNPSEVVGLRTGEAFPALAEMGIVSLMREVARGGRSDCFRTVWRKDPNELRHLEGMLYRLPCGQVVTVFSDVSDRVRAEDELRAERDRLELVTRNAGVGLALVDRQGRTAWANEVMRELFGDTLGRRCHEAYSPLSETGEGCPVERVLATGEERAELEQTGRTASGERIWAQVIASPVRDREGRITGVLQAVVPVTERKLLEEQLRQVQKMEAVGRLAGGVAHDFNNLLTAIRGYAELLAEDLPAGGKMNRDAREIVLAADRAAALTRQLLAFSRRQVMALEVIDANASLRSVAGLLRRMIGEDIRLILRLNPALGPVRVDPTQFEQVIINLGVNARDAMPQGGSLIIATRNFEFDQALIKAHPDLKPGPGVLLEVRDNGEGMDERVLSHIFEPFYTTKAKGKGTGLGLSTVFGIIKQSGGDISVESTPGQGTVFRIYLPRAKQRPAAAAPGPAQDEPGRGRETVLLVEDEEAVRSLTARLLRSQGYRVLEAGGGAEALRLAEELKEPLDILVTDVVMPGLSGRELARRLCELRPRLKVLYISGYAEKVVAHHGVLDPGIAFLPKPFTRQGLLRKVRETLDYPSLTKRT